MAGHAAWLVQRAGRAWAQADKVFTGVCRGGDGDSLQYSVLWYLLLGNIWLLAKAAAFCYLPALE